MRPVSPDIFALPAYEAAPLLLGKILQVGERQLRITETEAYYGEEDTACHAHKGRTPRTEMLYRSGGYVYVYLCYGMHNLLNIITGPEEHPEGVLIRCCEGAVGPGKLTKALGVDRSFNGENLFADSRLSILDDGKHFAYITAPRVGIGYASEEDQARLWRFILGEEI